MKKLILLGLSAMLLGACSDRVSGDNLSSYSQSEYSNQKEIRIALATNEGTDFDSIEYTSQADEENYMNLAGYTNGPITVYVIYEDTVIDTFETDDDNAFLYSSRTNKTDTTIYLTTDDSLNFGDTIDSLSELEDEPVKVDISPNESYLASESSSKSAEESKESIKKVDLENARTDLTYDDLMRYSDDYYGEIVELSGTVLQTVQGDGEVQHRVALNDDYDTVVLIGYESGTSSTKILEDDYITFAGTALGTTTYETVMGAEVEIPVVYVEEVSIN